MTKNKFINGVADQTTVRTNDSLYKYNAEKNIWLINRLSKTVDISDYKDDIINNIENKLGTVTASSLGLFEGDALLVPEDFWVWSDYAGGAAINMDVGNTILFNYGTIIGKGGAGGAALAWRIWWSCRQYNGRLCSSRKLFHWNYSWWWRRRRRLSLYIRWWRSRWR